jgi:hypothetical protein
MPKVELFWFCRRIAGDSNLVWVLTSRKYPPVYAIVRGKFTMKGEAYFIAEYYIANKAPNKEQAPTLAATMALAEAHYADLGYVEANRWNERVGGVEGLTDTAGETDLAGYREK